MKDGDVVRLVKSKNPANSVTEGKEYAVSNVKEGHGEGEFYFNFPLDVGIEGNGIFPSCAFGEWELVTPTDDSAATA